MNGYAFYLWLQIMAIHIKIYRTNKKHRYRELLMYQGFDSLYRHMIKLKNRGDSFYVT